MQVQVWIQPWAKFLPLRVKTILRRWLLSCLSLSPYQSGLLRLRKFFLSPAFNTVKESLSPKYIGLYLHCHASSAGCVEDGVTEWSWRKLISEEWRSLKTTSWSYSFMLPFFPDGSEGGLWFLTSHSWWFGGELSCLFVDRRFTERGEHYHVPKEQQMTTQATHHWDRVEGMKVLNCLWKNVLTIRNITKVIFKVYMEFLKEAGEHKFFVPCLM